MKNVLMVIFPYSYEGTWVFDDPSTDLVREPFVCGIPEMIELLVAEIDNAEAGFKLLFAASPFPGYQFELTRLREEMGGYWYRLAGERDGWLCPALFKYFDEAPNHLYVKAEKK